MGRTASHRSLLKIPGSEGRHRRSSVTSSNPAGCGLISAGRRRSYSQLPDEGEGTNDKSAETPTPQSRGWKVLRSHWHSYNWHRGDMLNRVLSDLPYPGAPGRVERRRQESKSYRLEDETVAGGLAASAVRTAEVLFRGEPAPRNAADPKRLGAWRKAENIHFDVRRLLMENGWPPCGNRVAPTTSSFVPVDAKAAALFPREWWDVVTDEAFAELVVDAFADHFVDALIDGSVALLAVASSRPSLPKSASAPGLRRPQTSPAELAIPKPIGQAPGELAAAVVETPTLGRRQRHAAPPSTAPASFATSGLQMDNWDSWSNRQFHQCRPQMPYIERISSATASQRPRRRNNQGEQQVTDHRKWSFPMSATNFPEVWGEMSAKLDTQTPMQKRMAKDAPESIPQAPPKVKIQMSEAAPMLDDKACPRWLLKVGKEGLTTYPYSLLAHRAFFQAQKTEALQEKAKKIAPIRLSDSWDPPWEMGCGRKPMAKSSKKKRTSSAG